MDSTVSFERQEKAEINAKSSQMLLECRQKNHEVSQFCLRKLKIGKKSNNFVKILLVNILAKPICYFAIAMGNTKVRSHGHILDVLKKVSTYGFQHLNHFKS